MNGPPLRATLTFFLPPLKPRVRDVMIDAGTQTAGNLALDFAQLCQHRLLGVGRVKPREISRRGEHARRIALVSGTTGVVCPGATCVTVAWCRGTRRVTIAMGSGSSARHDTATRIVYSAASVLGRVPVTHWARHRRQAFRSQATPLPSRRAR
jgi:hypothetical protein